ncbi:hypothetical protein QQ045_014336 [Rhodiola kirilowii]
MKFPKATGTSGVGKEQIVSLPQSNTSVWAGNIIQMMQLRKKILNLREIIDLPPRDESGPILELILGTVNDFKMLYPDDVPEFLVKDKENTAINKALVHFYNALRAMGNVWAKNQKRIPDLMVDTNDDSFENMKLEELGERLLSKLDGMINMARKMLDAMDEDEKNKENRIQGWASGDTLNESYLDKKNTCPSPVTTIPFLPEQKLLMKFGELAEASRSHQLLMPLRLQSLGQLSPTVVRKLSPSKSPLASPNRSEEQKMVVDKQKAKLLATTNNNLSSGAFKIASNVEEVPKYDAPSLLEARRNKAENSITQPANSSSAVTYPAPPPLLQSLNGSSPPPPTQISLANGSAPLPSPLPPVTQAAKSAPPPPPALCAAKVLCAKKTNTKLKKSCQMGNLYRLLKGKVEGSNLNKKQGGQNSKIGGASGGKQGMTDALAEMARRSAYFQQIEADVKNYANSIMEVKAALISFQSKNMTELTNFHVYVEEHLEKLKIEMQVLARFEGFPSKKLETLRMAAALFATLERMAKTLENWKVDCPLGQQLQRVETHFTKEAKTAEYASGSNSNGQLATCQKLLWRTFQLAYQVYSFAGGQDDRAERLTRELAKEIQTIPDRE